MDHFAMSVLVRELQASARARATAERLARPRPVAGGPRGPRLPRLRGAVARLARDRNRRVAAPVR